jgi:hypothetical protein
MHAVMASSKKYGPAIGAVSVLLMLHLRYRLPAPFYGIINILWIFLIF